MNIHSMLKRLASIEEPKGTVVTLTLDLEGTGALPPSARNFLKKEVAGNLASEARPIATQEALRKIYRQMIDGIATGLASGTKGLYLVAGPGLWEQVELKFPLKNFVTVGKEAYLAPLMAAEARHPRAYLVEVNADEAVIHELHLGSSQVLRTLGGGLSKIPQERLRTSRSKAHLSTGPGSGGSARDREKQRKEESGRGLSHHAAEAVLELHAAHPAEAVYVAGPQDAFGEFASRMTPELKTRTFAIGARGKDELKHAFDQLHARVDERLKQEIQEFQERRAQGLQAALGPRDVLERLYAGEVSHIYLDEYEPIPGVLCTGCGVREPGLRARCAFCGEDIVATSITQDVVKHALMHPPIALTFLGKEDGWLRDLGHMAGLLTTKGARRRTTPALK